MTDDPRTCQANRGRERSGGVLASPAMAKVTGLGGVFVKAKDKAALQAWYAEMLGLDISSWGGAELPNLPGTTATWSTFAADSTYFPGAFMINFRVDDADGLVAALRAKGANVLDRKDDSELGKFRYVVDPDGTLLELWEPAPTAP